MNDQSFLLNIDDSMKEPRAAPDAQRHDAQSAPRQDALRKIGYQN
jgi:hypothetical protein